jgi:hypothetical protein
MVFASSTCHRQERADATCYTLLDFQEFHPTLDHMAGLGGYTV